MKTLKLTKYNDPGHGWLRVSKTLLQKLGVSTTSYSYETKTYGYLEEDCDAPKFLSAARAAGYEIEVVNKYTNKPSHIRRY